jgi:hypothetical protein
MSERALKALLGTLVGFCILWAAISFFPRSEGGAEGPSGELSTFFEGVTAEGVTAVRFIGPGEEILELKRVGGSWQVNSFRADSGTVARFWEAVGEAEVGDLVASNPANHPRLGVTTDSAWTMEVQLPAESRSLLVGKGGSRYGTAFVRFPGEDAVHLLEGNVRSHLTRSLDDWRNKRVAAVDTAAVWRVELERDDGGFALERADSLWVLAGGEATNAATVRAILGEMTRLDASGFYAPGDSLADLGGTVRALDQGGSPLLYLEVGGGDGDRWIRVEGDSITYRLSSWRAGRLLPSAEDVAGEGQG